MRKERVVDKIEVLELGHLQIRHATYLVEDDGTRTLLGYHRAAYEPGMSVEAEDAAVQRIAAVAWTPEIVAAHRARLEAQARTRERAPA